MPNRGGLGTGASGGKTNIVFVQFYNIFNNHLTYSTKYFCYKLVKPWTTPGLSHSIFFEDKHYKISKRDQREI